MGADPVGERLVGEEPLGELTPILPARACRAGASWRSACRRPRSDALLEELRAREAEEEDRGVARKVGEVLDQVEQRRLGPVDVLEDEDERPVVGELLEQAADREEALLEATAAALIVEARRTVRPPL